MQSDSLGELHVLRIEATGRLVGRQSKDHKTIFKIIKDGETRYSECVSTSSSDHLGQLESVQVVA